MHDSSLSTLTLLSCWVANTGTKHTSIPSPVPFKGVADIIFEVLVFLFTYVPVHCMHGAQQTTRARIPTAIRSLALYRRDWYPTKQENGAERSTSHFFAILSEPDNHVLGPTSLQRPAARAFVSSSTDATR